MKRTIAIVAGLAILAASYFGGRSLGQQPGGSAPPAVIKVGVVNIGTVFMKYEKAKIFKVETENILKPFKEEGEKLKKLIIDWNNALQNPMNTLTKEQREQGERTIVDCKRRLEDLDREARKKIGKRNEEQIVHLYQDINSAIQKVAVANGFHLVLGYGEPPAKDSTELLTFPNISRKMSAMDMGAMIPMYYGGGVDISDYVIANLNAGFPAAGGPTPR